MMKRFLAVAAVMAAPVLTPGVALADGHITEEKSLVLACLELVWEGTEWTQCVGMMFKPCEGNATGSDEHTACLVSERDSWRAALSVEQNALSEILTPSGNIELSDIINGWARFSDQKCQESSLERGGSPLALHGCEIAEVVSATAELVACREGRSTAQFCVFKEDG